MITVMLSVFETINKCFEREYEEVVTIKLKAVIHRRSVPRFGAGGHNQPPRGTLAGETGSDRAP